MTASGSLSEVAAERARQDARWGQQNHPNGTGKTGDRSEADHARAVCDRAARSKRVTWRHIMAEEVAEAFAESDPARLRAELVQVAAVAAAWAEAIDRATQANPAAGVGPVPGLVNAALLDTPPCCVCPPACATDDSGDTCIDASCGVCLHGCPAGFGRTCCKDLDDGASGGEAEASSSSTTPPANRSAP